MKISFFIKCLTISILFISLYSCAPISDKEEKVSAENVLPKVAVLGVLHFVSKDNTVNQKFTDVMGSQRQQQLEELVEKLKKFNPTKIAVERPYRTNRALNQRYRDYLAGKYELTAEETDQIAFRLGKLLQHKKLYLAFHPVEYAFDSAVAFANANQQAFLIDSIIKNAKDLASEYDQIAEKGTISDAILYLNTESAIQKNHYGYLLLSQIGDADNHIGADVVGDWYASNIKIFQNIRRLATSASDRILVIYGQGHCKILNQLIEDSPELDFVDVNDYLQ